MITPRVRRPPTWPVATAAGVAVAAFSASAGTAVAARVARRTGATDAEVVTRLPGDELVPSPVVVCDRAVTLAASPTQVWPWIVQLGKDRGGWYLPMPLAALVPPRRRGSMIIRPDLQGLREGAVVPDWGPQDFRVVELVEGSHVLYEGVRDPAQVAGRRPVPMMSWVMTIAPTPEGGTRLHMRLRLWGLWKRRRLLQTGGGLIDYLTVALLFAGLRQRLRRGT